MAKRKPKPLPVQKLKHRQAFTQFMERPKKEKAITSNEEFLARHRAASGVPLFRMDNMETIEL